MGQSPFMHEVSDIIKNGTSLTTHSFSASLYNGKDWVQCYNVFGVQCVRDYTESFGSMLYVTIQVAIGDFLFDVLPNRRTLKLTLKDRRNLKGRAEVKVVDYVAILLNQEDTNITAPNDYSVSKSLINQQGFITLELQCFDEATYRVRMESVGGIFRSTTPINVLKTLLGRTTELKGTDNRKLVKGIEVFPGSNETPRNQIVIPHGMRLVDVALYLQEREGGLFSAGCGCFLQDGVWYVYPTHDVTMLNRYPKTLTILLMSDTRMQTETTYRKVGDNLTIIANGQNITMDLSQSHQLNEATGVRFHNATQLVDNGSTPTKNRVMISRNKNMSEFKTINLDDSLANAQFAEERVTSNPHKHYSRLARGNCKYFDIEWRYGDLDLIFPGMPLQVITLESGEVKTRNGIIANVGQNLIPVQEGAVKETYAGSIRMGIFVEINDIT